MGEIVVYSASFTFTKTVKYCLSPFSVTEFPKHFTCIGTTYQYVIIMCIVEIIVCFHHYHHFPQGLN